MPVSRLQEELYLQNRIETVKARWTQEEISILVRREAEISLRDVRFINQELLGFLPDQTLEFVKNMGKRAANYRALVQEHIARINREAEASMTVRTQPADVEENTRSSNTSVLSVLPPSMSLRLPAYMRSALTLAGRNVRRRWRG